MILSSQKRFFEHLVPVLFAYKVAKKFESSLKKQIEPGILYFKIDEYRTLKIWARFDFLLDY